MFSTMRVIVQLDSINRSLANAARRSAAQRRARWQSNCYQSLPVRDTPCNWEIKMISREATQLRAALAAELGFYLASVYADIVRHRRQSPEAYALDPAAYQRHIERSRRLKRH